MRSLHFQRLLGSGAFGSVYLADLVGDRGFRRQVAVKVLLKENAHGEMFMSRVRDEARLLGLLADDHILKVLELAKVDGRDAVLMEYVEGVDLAATVEAGFRPPPRALAELGAAVAGALHRAHRAVHPGSGEPLNVIHRDVKPANVMITSRGSVKLLDFGVARARFESRESHTGQFVLGTLNYMAPEYIVTGEVSPAADIYGLALTLWESACGEVFGQPKLRQDLHQTRVEERLELISGTHAELVPILRQMLAWEPRSRPDGAALERAFIAAMDMLRGTGLRSWAGDAVPQVIAKEREAARDEVGFLGRTITLGVGDAEAIGEDISVARPPAGSAAPLRPSPSAPSQPHARPLPRGDDEQTLGVPPPWMGPSATASPTRTGGSSGAPAGAPPLGTSTSGGRAATPPAAQSGPRPVPAAAPARPTSGASPALPTPSTGAQRRPTQRSAKPRPGNILLLQGLLLGGGLGLFLLMIVGALLILRGLR
ncbi:MAG: protein kinase [Pseudomonadota bacterium]|nr:protein kinase [Pseudomonadota bacterium]